MLAWLFAMKWRPIIGVKSRMTQQKRAKERKRMEKAQRKKEAKLARQMEKQLRTEEDDEELELLDGPQLFKDFDMSDIKI